jgi:hypothetical protein
VGLRTATAVAVAAALFGTIGIVGPARAADATTSHNHTPVPAVSRIVGTAPGWGISGKYTPFVRDFDGDGYSDIFWYHPGLKRSSIWFGGANGDFTSVTESITGSYHPVVLDINGDGRSDILWHGPPDLPDRIWLGNANRTFTSREFSSAGNADLQPYALDFNGDGHPDILWYSPSGGNDYMWFGRGDGTFTWRGVSIKGGYNVAVGDFEHIGRDQILLDGTWPGADTIVADALKSDGSFHDAEIGGTVPGGVPFAIDANRDGREDAFFYGPGNLEDQVGYSIPDTPPTSGPAFSLNTTSISGTNYIPLVGDFNGDGHDDIFWYGPGSAPDSIWFDVAHQIPAMQGSGPLQRWEVPYGPGKFPSAPPIADKSAVYALFIDGSLTAYSRSTGIPEWSRSVGAHCNDAQLQRQLEILRVTCAKDSTTPHTYVFTATTGAPVYDQPGATCRSNNSYYDARYLNGHLTVVAARTGAMIWQSPVAKVAPCALSGTRLMVAHVSEPGVVEYDFIAGRLVFDHDASHPIRFGDEGTVAMCSDAGRDWGLAPSGATAWSRDIPCVAPKLVHVDFGTNAVSSGFDVDIATGALLGRQSIPASHVYGAVERESTDGAMFSWRYAVTAVRVGQCLYDSDVAFAGPHGVSPLLDDASVVPIDFSHTAITVFAGNANDPCTRPQIEAYNQDGTVRWVLPQQWETGADGLVGTDIETNGGQEASVLVGVDANGIELVSLP